MGISPRKEVAVHIHSDLGKHPQEPGFSERYSFECYDITDPNYPSETSTCWLSNDKNVLDVIRHGQPGSKTTIYDIHTYP